jgi:lysylphosphatidylglycerol synthetase-like protein (DUF2156 family)
MSDQTSQQTERRAVRSEDPSLSQRANDLLTHELQEALGTDEVVVSRDVPDRSHKRHATHSPFVATLTANRPILIVTFLVALVLGGVVALATEQYWAVVVAAALHAVGTLAVAVGAIALTTNIDHVEPTVAARLEEEGVADPDRVLSELVEDFAGMRDARGVPEVLSTGHNERTATPEQDPARSSVQQRTAMTPTSGPAPVGGSNSAVEALEWWIIGAMSVLSIAVAAVIGGEMWALPAIFLPLGVGWIALQFWMARRRDSSQRPTGDESSAQRQLVAVAVFVVTGVIWFMLVVGWIGGLL